MICTKEAKIVYPAYSDTLEKSFSLFLFCVECTEVKEATPYLFRCSLDLICLQKPKTSAVPLSIQAVICEHLFLSLFRKIVVLIQF